jgi:hypothetical protein
VERERRECVAGYSLLYFNLSSACYLGPRISERKLFARGNAVIMLIISLNNHSIAGK